LICNNNCLGSIFSSKVIYYEIIEEYPNLENGKYLIFLQESTIPFEKCPEIVNNILNKQFE